MKKEIKLNYESTLTMSQSRIAPRKSSPCCIGCVIVLVVGVGILAAMGIFGYRFFKENIGIINVVNNPDPALDTPADVLFPESVADFERTALNEPGTVVPGMASSATSEVVTAKYKDTQGNLLTALAIPTEVARSQRSQDFGVLTASRGKANDPDVGISFKNPMDSGSTTLTWQKENWTFVLYTTSTVAAKFAEAYRPGGANTATEEPVDEATTPTTEVPATVPPETSPADTATTPAQ